MFKLLADGKTLFDILMGDLGQKSQQDKKIERVASK